LSVAQPVAYAALRHPAFRAYFIGAALGMMADSIEHVISYWMLFQKFGSPALAGFAVISHWLPFLLFSVWSGALADRFDPRRLIQIGMGLFMFVSFAWGVLFLTDSLEMWHAAALLVLHGLAGVLWMPASQILIHDIVDEKVLHSAIRLTATSRWLGLLFGPAVGGVILLAFGPAWGILFNVLFYLPFIWILSRLPFERKASSAGRRVRGFADIVATVREIAGNRTIVSMTLLAGAASFIVGNAYQAQMPEFAEHLGHGDGGVTYSVLFAADAAGALAAGLLLEGRGWLQAKPRSACLLAVAWCASIGAFALSTSYPLSLALLFCAGFMELAFFAMAQTLVQVNAPPESRGRVIGLFVMSALGLRAFGGVTVGLGGALIGVHWSLFFSAMALLAITLALLAFTIRR